MALEQAIPVQGTPFSSLPAHLLPHLRTGAGAAKALLQQRLARLGNLSADDLAVLERIAYQRKETPQDAVLLSGEEDFYPPRFLLSGWACQQIILHNGQRQILVFLLPGDIVTAERHLLGNIAALTPIVTADFPGEYSEPCILARALSAAKESRDWLFRQQVLRLGAMNAVSRTAHMLLEIAERFREVGLSDGNSIPFPISQAALSDALGMAPMHVNRTLVQFRDTGAIAYASRHSLRIDPGKLARAVNSGRA